MIVLLAPEDQCLTLECPKAVIDPIDSAAKGQFDGAWKELLDSIEFLFDAETKDLVVFLDGTRRVLHWYTPIIRFLLLKFNLVGQDVNKVKFQISDSGDGFFCTVEGKAPIKFSVASIFTNKYLQAYMTTSINMAIVYEQGARK